MKKPTIPIKLSVLDGILEGITAILFLAGIIYTGLHYFALPDIVPTHFGFNGQPDGYGNKSSMLVLTCMNIAIYALLTASYKFTELINYPFEINPANEEQHFRNVFLMIRTLKLVVVSLFTYIGFATIQIVLGQQTGLGRFVTALPIVLIVVLGIFVWKGYQIKKKFA